MLWSVMNRVEAPEEADLMGPAVSPVEAAIANDERGGGAQPERPGGDRRVHGCRNEAIGDVSRQ